MKHNKINLQDKLDQTLEAYRKDLRRSSEWGDAHTEGGMHLSKEQARQETLDVVEAWVTSARPDYIKIEDENGEWDRMQTLGYHKALDQYHTKLMEGLRKR